MPGLLKKVLLKPVKLYNNIRFFNYDRKCEICGYPLSVGRPYGYEYDPKTGEEIFTGTYWYQCDCFEEK